MADTLDGSVPKNNNKYWLLALLLIPFLCMGCYFSIPTDGNYYRKLVKRSPHLTEIHISEPELVTTLADCLYDLSWLNENTLQLRDCETDGISTIDVETGKTVYVNNGTEKDKETYISEFKPNGKDNVLATCPKEDLVIRGGSIQWGKYEISIWKQEQVIATFPFSSEQWRDVEKAASSYSGFSPTCKYFYLVLSGDIDVELYAQEELWLLDVKNKTFKLILTGGQYPSWGDSPLQSVDPRWSPDEQEFVFGNTDFGLEIYNLDTGKRRVIAGPNYKPTNPQWSPAGTWIAANSYGAGEKNDSLILFSPDRYEMAVSTPCYIIDGIAWSPNGKQLAYICADVSSQVKDSLWVWHVE